jgi:hypothetical protein
MFFTIGAVDFICHESKSPRSGQWKHLATR